MPCEEHSAPSKNYLLSEQHSLAMNLETNHSSIKKQIEHPTPMSGAIYVPPRFSRVRVSAVYTCADGT